MARQTMQDFSVTPATLVVLADVLRAVNLTARVRVMWRDRGEYVETTGTARHVVEPHSIGFAFTWTPECRLRVTATFEVFIPLHAIEYVIIDG